MRQLTPLMFALIMTAGIGACGQQQAEESATRQGDPAERAIERASGESPGMAQQALDTAEGLVGEEAAGAVSEMTGRAVEQAEELADDAVSQARDMAEDAAKEAMEDPEAAAEALKKRF